MIGMVIPFILVSVYEILAEKTSGTCTVSIEHAGPDYSTLDYLTFQPDKMRAQAGFVIEKCANQLGGMGGFVTLNFLAAEHYVESLANTIADDLRNETRK